MISNSIRDELVHGTDNLFVTGSAGTGKSYLMSHVTPMMDENTIVTASTGIAAIQIEGCTFHKFLGMGLFKGSAQSLLSQMLVKRKNHVDLFKKIHTLIFDEISMADIGTVIRASKVIGAIREDVDDVDMVVTPFGGIRMVFVGDFLQLPPIQVYGESSINPETGEETVRTYRYLFEHPIWDAMKIKVIHLTIPKRYDPMDKDDNVDFTGALLDVRMGTLSDRVKKLIGFCSRAPIVIDGIRPTVLIATNREVDSHNIRELKSLDGPEHEYASLFRAFAESEDISTTKDDMIRNIGVADRLKLKIGAQVMLMVNTVHDRLCNGSRGVVVGFNEMGVPIVRFLNDITMDIHHHIWRSTMKVMKGDRLVRHTVELTQIPLRLAWASTIHRSQGCTLDSVYLDIGTCFASGQLYVALSRCKDYHNMFVKGWKESVFNRCLPYKNAVKFYEDLPSSEE